MTILHRCSLEFGVVWAELGSVLPLYVMTGRILELVGSVPPIILNKILGYVDYTTLSHSSSPSL